MSIEEILKYDNLGTASQHHYLFFEIFDQDASCPYEDLKIVFANKSIEYGLSFRGMIKLLVWLSVIELSSNKIITANFSPISHIAFEKHFIKLILQKLNDSQMLKEFISYGDLKYDAEINKMIIKESCIPLKFSGFKKLLISYGFFYYLKEATGSLIINENFIDIFENDLMPKIRTGTSWAKSKLSIEQLKEILKLHEEMGNKAEEYVHEFERKRLVGHQLIERIMRISSWDARAGYDIVSFNDLNSSEINRFIEVKAFSNSLHFYWTQNEVTVSKRLGLKYFLYLVDLSKIEKVDYTPIIIQNPSSEVFESERWIYESMFWFIEPKQK